MALPKNLLCVEIEKDDYSRAYDDDNGVVEFGGHSSSVREAVRRWNAFDGLVEALEELVAEFDEQNEAAKQTQGCYGINETGGIIQARAALDAAKGGEE